MNTAAVDLVLWDLDETLLPTENFRAVRHRKEPCDLALLPEFEAVSPYDGIREVLDRVSGLLCGLVTSSPRWYVDQILEAHLAESIFDVIVTYEDVADIKPHPEALQIATWRLAINASRTLYIGDDLVDYQACHSAGVRFVGAGWAGVPTYPAEAESLKHPRDLVGILGLT